MPLEEKLDSFTPWTPQVLTIELVGHAFDSVVQ